MKKIITIAMVALIAISCSKPQQAQPQSQNSVNLGYDPNNYIDYTDCANGGSTTRVYLSNNRKPYAEIITQSGGSAMDFRYDTLGTRIHLTFPAGVYSYSYTATDQYFSTLDLIPSLCRRESEYVSSISSGHIVVGTSVSYTVTSDGLWQGTFSLKLIAQTAGFPVDTIKATGHFLLPDNN